MRITGAVIGTIEVGGLISSELGLSGSFWSWLEINVLGFVIFALFTATWVIALVIWRLGRIEERRSRTWRTREPWKPVSFP
jgi:nickel/cobalt transporter (NiCoT) family protein